MRILVTGGLGFIGSHFIRCALTDSGVVRIVNLDLVTYAADPGSLSEFEGDPRYEFVRGDICDGALLAGLFEKHRFDSVVHFAAETHVDRSIDSPEAFVRTNVHGTWQLLESARIHFRSLPETRERDRFRFLHVSTDEVFGALAPGAPKFTEESPCAPNSPYAASKAASDHFVRAYWRTYGLPTLTAHASNNYGPRQFPEKLIPLMIAKILRGEPLPIYGDGLQIRDWLHVEDCCRALWRMLLEGRVGESYNIGGGTELTNLAMVRQLVDLVNAQLPEGSRLAADQRIHHVGDRPGHDQRYAVDSGKIERELGWKPLETIDSGLRKTVEWYLDHADWLDRLLSGDYRGERLGAGTDAAATRDRVG